MPLLDHFHPPLSIERRWESFHSSWATRIADALTERCLPPNYIAEEHVHFGPSVEIDVATFNRNQTETDEANGGAMATLAAKVWTPPPTDAVIPGVFPDTFEVRILLMDAGPKLVAAIELISPGNKDRPAERRAFATKIAGYLYQGISVIVVDIVTNRRANLHNDVIALMEAPEALQTPPETTLYAAAYRPLRRSSGDQIDLWRSPLTLGGALPTLPLGLRADLAIPVDLDSTFHLLRGVPAQAAHGLLNDSAGAPGGMVTPIPTNCPECLAEWQVPAHGCHLNCSLDAPGRCHST